ncbi:MAG TPA: efflux RND transporter periplasmic adaptor subunit [Prolixibacteraceae bacterium]|nr:efflux RND transporter periplasmic adaptor subunit [Prolixibacteraceae bacterium]
MKPHLYKSQITMFSLLLSILLIISSCGNKTKTAQKEKTGSDTPPSLSGVKPENLVKLSEKELAELKIQVLPVTSSFQKYNIAVPGVVFPAPNHISIISTPIDGRISKIEVQEGEPVRKGQELFSIESLEFGNMVSEYLQAVSEETFQTSRFQRLEQLVEQTISSKSELDRARSDFQRAKTSVIAAVSKLKAIGVPDKEINAFKSAESIDPTLKIHAPISGTMDQRSVELGQSVNALQMLARVLDMSHVLVRGYISPEDARFITPGDSVKISRRQNDTNVMNAIVTSINPGLDENNRSVIVNVLLATKDSWPKPGENLHLSIETTSRTEVITVPMEALTYEGNDPIVFIQLSETTFEKKKVDVQEFRNRNAVVRNGLDKNDKLAVTQVFSLKALSRFDKIAEE